MEIINKKDIQAIVISGYSELHVASFILLKITDPAAARTWLNKNIPEIAEVTKERKGKAVNIAFTFDGLRAWGLGAKSLDSFPLEFAEGMATEYKQAFLGDYGSSEPAKWQWGGKNDTPVHLLLMLYAENEDILNGLYSELCPVSETHGLEEIKRLNTTNLSNLVKRKEHFGFHDGISQPTIAGLDRQDIPENTIAAGEFILGYRNEYGQYTDIPGVPLDADPKGLLPDNPATGAMKGLGVNGSFVVFRQMEQNVDQFWKYMESKNLDANGQCIIPEMIHMASKAVGRWPNGTPVVLSPGKEEEHLQEATKFGYIPADKEGLKCPFGAHIRRTNPRDAIDRGAPTSIEVSKKHRLIRRGRAYGQPVVANMNPADIIKNNKKDGERGLYFICLNANLTRQFEFVQNFWVNNPKFDGLYDERDPIIGNSSNPNDAKTSGTFGIPSLPVRKRYTDLPEFVTIRGGAYFFLPGIKALNYLGSI